MRTLILAFALLALTSCGSEGSTTPAAPDPSILESGPSPSSALRGGPGQRLTRGDAEAVLNAFGTAGYMITARKGFVPVRAAPGDFYGDKGAIRPLPYLDGHHYCTLDWLVPVAAIFDFDDPGTPPRTAAEIRAELGLSSVVFTIDGQPFPTRRTPVKPFNAQRLFGYTNAFGYQAGKPVPPGTFAIGAHTFHLDAFFDGAVDFTTETTFFIDGAASAACTG